MTCIKAIQTALGTFACTGMCSIRRRSAFIIDCVVIMRLGILRTATVDATAVAAITTLATAAIAAAAAVKADATATIATIATTAAAIAVAARALAVATAVIIVVDPSVAVVGRTDKCHYAIAVYCYRVDSRIVDYACDIGYSYHVNSPSRQIL